MKRIIMSGMLGLALTVGLASGAFAAKIDRTITLGPNMIGEFTIPGIDIGDEVTLRLVNPTGQPLVFHTDEAIGTEESWTVPANSQRVITFTYTQPFTDDVEFHVMDATGNTIAQGLLLDLKDTAQDIEETVENVADADVDVNVDVGEGSPTRQEVGEDIFNRTITLRAGQMSAITMEDLGIGDEVRLTLVNPTSQPLTFSTTQMLGAEKSWTVPANSQRTVSFTYNRPFDDDVEFVVMSGNTQISQGVLFDIADEQQLGEDVFKQTITLQPGMGEIVMEDLGVGDDVQLTLVNPTSQPLTFSTTEQLGAESSWTVPANSQRVVSFTYNRPFDDDVEFQVTGASGQVVSQGVLIESQGTTSVQQRQTIRGFW